MLTKRTNLLLEKTDYQLLYALAKRQEVSVAELIRKAIEKTYKQDVKAKLDQRKRTAASIERIWETIQIERLDYKSLIEDGRKY